MVSDMYPAQRLHALAGSPPIKSCEDKASACVVCAQTFSRTMQYDRWQGSAFTDQNKLRGLGLSARVCEPCVWAHAWVAPPDKESNPSDAVSATGAKAKGLNLRLFSHFWSERDGYRSLHKGEKPAIREWMRARVDGERWWAAISDTGQKHTIPWVREQRRARGIVRFEERDVQLGDWSLVDVMTHALTAGVTKAEIESGMYSPRSWELAASHVRSLMALADEHMGSGWWSLGIWMAQRDEAQVAQRMAEEKVAKAARKTRARGPSAEGRGGARGDSRARARDAERVPGGGSEPARPLEPSPRSAASGSEDERDARSGSDGVSERASAGRAQLGFSW